MVTENTAYINEAFNLTEREADFVHRFLYENGCGANTPEELLGDNYSCQGMCDLQEIFSEMNDQEIGGFLSSLDKKGVLVLEEREDENGFGEKIEMEDLWWVTEDYLKSLDPHLQFEKGIEEEEDEGTRRASLKNTVINLFSHIESDHAVEVLILEDNKYQVGEKLVFQNMGDFCDRLTDLAISSNLVFDGGNDMEFYLSSNGGKGSYTFQVSPFEYDKDIDL